MATVEFRSRWADSRNLQRNGAQSDDQLELHDLNIVFIVAGVCWRFFRTGGAMMLKMMGWANPNPLRWAPCRTARTDDSSTEMDNLL